ncbi:CDP-diacylglycerol--inositol 3-phosphatidyltransferase [Starmerella bacillaris]|uniref:CDP-diacylglycerol--inositol 3-phosphatidyltransferase n=1 Tax=Starmerella bacillaris TaxID=1247836 RepID=A0AAV5RIS3_STABA|nr:CDP-diacylglycerol--inositol 3-phosphatidyltransferase [Starmerella bacillaris]
MTETTVKRVRTKDVLLYVPNLIGYSRVAFALIALYFMKWHPKYCTIAYCLSCILDALDGHAARRLGQTSQFGAILDMVTDRCTTSSLICFLCVAYPQYVVLFQLLVSLDLASHYMHMYSTLSSGATSHKKFETKSKLLQLYYTNNKVLFIVCAANELFYVGLYLYSFPLKTPPTLGYVNSVPLSFAVILTVTTFPLWLLKQFLNIVQMRQAGLTLAYGDALAATKALQSKST